MATSAEVTSGAAPDEDRVRTFLRKARHSGPGKLSFRNRMLFLDGIAVEAAGSVGAGPALHRCTAPHLSP